MRTRGGLRLRFTLAGMALVFVISALSAVAVFTSQEYMEDRLLEQLMQREVDEFARLYAIDPAQVPPRSAELRSYVVGEGERAALPPELREIAPGIWHDVLIGGRNFQVANHALPDQRRLYLTYDITDVERREAGLSWVLGAVVLVATALAGLFGWSLSRIAVAPVVDLAAQIKAHEPGRAEPALAQRVPDADLAVIASAFDAYARRLAEFIERERAFTEDVSHELRTPISVVTTAVERLQADAALPAELKPAVERIARAGNQMQLTTQALLFMAREAEPTEAAMRLVPLRAVIEQVVALQQRRWADRPFAFHASLNADGPTVPQGLAAVVIDNLLSNAVEHSGAAAAELVQVGAQVTVRDRGAGIPSEELPHIFERRTRGAGSHGHGLGLHIVKRICDRQGWALEAHSALGQGTVLSVRFAAAG